MRFTTGVATGFGVLFALLFLYELWGEWEG